MPRSCQLQRNAVQLTGRDRAGGSRKSDSDHSGTISTTVRVRRTSWNAMKPRFQCGRIQLVVATVS
jgi:hypothetical protein